MYLASWMVFGKSWVYLCLSISANVLLGTYYLFFNFHCSVFLFLIETVVVLTPVFQVWRRCGEEWEEVKIWQLCLIIFFIISFEWWEEVSQKHCMWQYVWKARTQCKKTVFQTLLTVPSWVPSPFCQILSICFRQSCSVLSSEDSGFIFST